MLNGIFVVAVLASILLAAHTGRMPELTAAILDDSRKAVDVALKLVGVMAFFLGLMKVAEEGGLLRDLARLVRPVMRRLFPAVPPEHPAMSAMVLNIASNLLGLANAATPFGIRAMEELDKLNGRKGTATNAMALFLAINTAGLALLPSGAIALRAAAGSREAAAILVPTWFASGCATTVGIVAALVLARLPAFRRSEPPAAAPLPGPEAPSPAETDSVRASGAWRRRLLALFWLVLLVLLGRHLLLELRQAAPFELAREVLSHWMLPALVAALVLYGWSRRVRVYDSLVEGAKEGFQVALRIIPFLVAILVAVGMFRASGAMALIVDATGPLTGRIGLPSAALPMAILRPLSGSGAMAVMVEAMDTYGPDSLVGTMVSTFQGSTETTFYVLAVYCGAVGVKRTRHTLPACLLADVAGILGAVLIVQLLFG